MDSLRKSRVSQTLASISIFSLMSARGTMAHGHNVSKIQAGEYMSDDPIVCFQLEEFARMEH